MQFTADQLHELKAAFNGADQDYTGRLGSDQLCQALRELGLEAPVMDIKSTRQEKEGYISFNDFKEIVSDLMQSSPLDMAFGLLADTVRGGITLESLRLAHESQGEKLTLTELQEMMAEGDRNHDGMIDREEFCRIWKKTGL
ncbi:hypothetical protein DFQ28_001861 [Apophysomyces sp. BC1034]|nr:hypothetical protein DFQ29_007795 [Apophysomyces sp. BC1021]KAG0194060.1 hypothetical protein DFQ28_001861 [Apophysomyces sp. BC1034]